MEMQNVFKMNAKLSQLLRLNPEKYKAVQEDCNNKRSLEEIFSSVWDLEEAHQTMTPKLVIHEKSEMEADGLRSEGNAAYEQKDFQKALKLYNMSIMMAPHPAIQDCIALERQATNTDKIFDCPVRNPSRYGGTTEDQGIALSLGYANRSALLFDLKFYKKCIDDIELALRYGYPEEKRPKLEQRKQKCQTFLTDGESPRRNVASLSNSPSIKDLLSSTAPIPPKLREPNLIFPSLSNAVTVAYTSSKGRGLVAVQDICPGEILAVDRAYSVSIEEEELTNYCNTCLEFCLTPLPCPGCTKIIFCSEACRTTGLSEDHWLDCIIFPTIIALGMPHTNLPYKLLKSYSQRKVLSFHKQLEEKKYASPEYSGCNEDGIYRSSSYQAVHHLCQNKDDNSSTFFFAQATYSFVITKLLHMSGRYFVDDNCEPVVPTREDFVSAGAILLSHILRLECNQHMITDFQLERSIGSGLFPTASLANHSCYHSAHHYMFGRILVLRALRPIKSGEEITTSYTKGFADQTLVERKIKLKSYRVNCNCEACVLRWPRYEALPMYNFKCIICGQQGKDYNLCTNCLGKQKQKSNHRMWISINKEIDTAVAKVREVDLKVRSNGRIVQKDLKTVCDASELVHRHLLMPCQCLLFVESILRCCIETGI